MKKVILDFYDVLFELPLTGENSPVGDFPVSLADAPGNKNADYKELIHNYIAEKLDFPDYYGKNLDALYDCLTDIDTPTAVGFFIPVPDEDDLSIDFMIYLDRIKKVFLDAERDNPECLAVICADDSGALADEEDPDEALSDFFSSLSGDLY